MSERDNETDLSASSTQNPTSAELEEYIKKQDEKDTQYRLKEKISSGVTTKVSDSLVEAKKPENALVLAFGFATWFSGMFFGLFLPSWGFDKLIMSFILFAFAGVFYAYRYKEELGRKFAGMTMLRRG